MRAAMSPVWSGANEPLTQKLAPSIPLAAHEIKLLMDWQSATRLVPRGQQIIVEGKASQTLFIVIEGIAIRYRILRDGGRHVLNVLLPGDIAGVPGCFFETALYSVRTISNARIAPIPIAQIIKLFHTHPQLAAKIFWWFSCEAAICAEHLIAVGRRTALERVGHFLLELLTRLQAARLADERSFRLPLTQELIADALGLSIPYVNKILCNLRDDDLVCIKDKVVVINDVEALSTLVDFDHSYLKPLSIRELLNEAADSRRRLSSGR